MKKEYNKEQLLEALKMIVKLLNKKETTDGIESIEILSYLTNTIEKLWINYNFDLADRSGLARELDSIGFLLDFEDNVYSFTEIPEEASIKSFRKAYPNRYYILNEENSYLTTNGTRFRQLFDVILKTHLPSSKMMPKDRIITDNNIFSNDENVEKYYIENLSRSYLLETHKKQMKIFAKSFK